MAWAVLAWVGLFLFPVTLEQAGVFFVISADDTELVGIDISPLTGPGSAHAGLLDQCVGSWDEGVMVAARAKFVGRQGGGNQRGGIQELLNYLAGNLLWFG